ncbi:MAG: class II fumarate hydratase [Deltaproteobacteria bacterium]|nr:class II fumarate hydratase [Deltaproteobacteria bacterium]
MKTREEADAMGTVFVPADAYYGAGTQRAVENFPLSGIRMPISIIHALALIKTQAASVNRELQLLDERLAEAIIRAAREVMSGQWDHQFPLDVFQTGSGTSSNMNVNEVIAGRANELLTGKVGGKAPVHPNDHVNLCQSSNDAVPSAIQIAAFEGIRKRLLPGLDRLRQTLRHKSETFADIVKIGRTHLQDAVPLTLGQEFGGYARQVELGMKRVQAVEERLAELPLGGTAVGTGVNAHPRFASNVISAIAAETGYPFVEAGNHFEAQGARDASVETSGALKTVAVSLTKIANDLRWLSCGPRTGFAEITIPSLQPGSSIMPGKVNPVIPEAVLQAAAQVIGNDVAITLGGQAGNFELNVMMPLIGYNLLQSVDLLSNASTVLAEKCVDGISANRDKCTSTVEKSLAMATYLVPEIGYDQASELAKEAFRTGETVREVAGRKGIELPDRLEETTGHSEK